MLLYVCVFSYRGPCKASIRNWISWGRPNLRCQWNSFCRRWFPRRRQTAQPESLMRICQSYYRMKFLRTCLQNTEMHGIRFSWAAVLRRTTANISGLRWKPERIRGCEVTRSRTKKIGKSGACLSASTETQCPCWRSGRQVLKVLKRFRGCPYGA